MAPIFGRWHRQRMIGRLNTVNSIDSTDADRMHFCILSRGEAIFAAQNRPRLSTSEHICTSSSFHSAANMFHTFEGSGSRRGGPDGDEAGG